MAAEDDSMASTTVSISLPEDLVAEIDKQVGEDARSAFVLDSTRSVLRRRKLDAFLADDEPAWKDEDHPDLVAMGTYAWVRQLREESDRRPALNPPYCEDEE